MSSVSRHRYAFTAISSNKKLGPIPATGTSRDSCPPTCSFRPDKAGGCYAAQGPSSWQWAKLDKPDNDKALTLEQLADKVARLRKHTLWRANQYGDLPQTSMGKLDVPALEILVEASRRTDGFTYTHSDLSDEATRNAIHKANKVGGLVINLSAEGLVDTDRCFDLGIGPVVTVLPAVKPGASIQEVRKPVFTPKGRQITVCPTYYDSSMTCASCGICQKAGRRSAVGFVAHGAAKARVEKVFWAAQTA